VTIVVKLRVLLLLLLVLVVVFLILLLLLLLGDLSLLLLLVFLHVDLWGLLNRMYLRDLNLLVLLIFGLSVNNLFLLHLLVDLLTCIDGERRSFSLLALQISFAFRQGIGKIHDLGPSGPVEVIEADLDSPIFLVFGHAARKFHRELHQLI